MNATNTEAQVNIEASWKQRLHGEFEKDYFQQLTSFVKEEFRSGEMYPAPSKIFSAFDFCPFDKVKVVILGQDPYHGEGQANGLCFSVNPGIKHPPSLRNIFKELEMDLGIRTPESGDLSRWAEQGVLMLNATLTVRAKSPGSHQGKGWEEFTDAVISALNAEKKGVVYMLWGSYAQKKGFVIDREANSVIISPHPSPFSAHRGFFGSKPFSRANDYLRDRNSGPISW